MDALLLLLVLVAAEGAEAADEIRVEAATTIVREPRRRLGIDCDYLVDGDREALIAALRPLAPGLIRYPGGGKSQTSLWSVPP